MTLLDEARSVKRQAPPILSRERWLEEKLALAVKALQEQDELQGGNGYLRSLADALSDKESTDGR